MSKHVELQAVSKPEGAARPIGLQNARPAEHKELLGRHSLAFSRPG